MSSGSSSSLPSPSPSPSAAPPGPGPSSGAGVVAASLDKDNNTITLISQDEQKFQLARRAALQSTLVKTALEDDKETNEVALVHIHSSSVKKVVDYLVYHQDRAPRRIEAPLKSTNMKELVDRWDANFVDDCDLDMLMRLLLAANYMDIKSLLELLCAKVASLMKGKTASQIRRTFNIRDEFTPEEYDEIKSKFPELLPIDLEKPPAEKPPADKDKDKDKGDQKANTSK